MKRPVVISMNKPPTPPRMSDTFASICVKRTKLPNGLTVQRELGRGGNNRVYAALVDGEPCVLRAPRRRSDTHCVKRRAHHVVRVLGSATLHQRC